MAVTETHYEKSSWRSLVMGTHGRSALRGLLPEPVTGKLITHGDTPVTVVR